MRRSLVPALLLPLAGCPFIFEPPNYVNVDLGDGDTDVDADTDADADVDTDVEPPAGVPQVVEFKAWPHFEETTIVFSIVDTDVDLVGGLLTLNDGVQAYDFLIPGDIPNWTATDTNRITLPRPRWAGCEAPLTETWTITVKDFGQHVSQPKEHTVTVAQLGDLPDLTDFLGVSYHAEAQDLDLPVIACITTDAAGAGGGRESELTDALKADIESILFDVAPGRYRAEFEWDDDVSFSGEIFPYPLQDEVPADGYPDTLCVGSPLDQSPEPGTTSCSFDLDEATALLVNPQMLQWDTTTSPEFRVVMLLSPE